MKSYQLFQLVSILQVLLKNIFAYSIFVFQKLYLFNYLFLYPYV